MIAVEIKRSSWIQVEVTELDEGMNWGRRVAMKEGEESKVIPNLQIIMLSERSHKNKEWHTV